MQVVTTPQYSGGAVLLGADGQPLPLDYGETGIVNTFWNLDIPPDGAIRFAITVKVLM